MTETRSAEETAVEEAADAFEAGNYAAQKEIRIFADASEGAAVLATFEAEDANTNEQAAEAEDTNTDEQAGEDESSPEVTEDQAE